MIDSIKFEARNTHFDSKLAQCEQFETNHKFQFANFQTRLLFGNLLIGICLEIRN